MVPIAANPEPPRGSPQSVVRLLYYTRLVTGVKPEPVLRGTGD